jgi:ribonuclease HI
MNGLIDNKDSVIEDYRNIINRLTNTALLDDEEVKLKSESEVTLELIRKKVNENANSVINQEDYQRSYDELVTRFETVKTKLNHISEHRLKRRARHEKLTEA